MQFRMEAHTCKELHDCMSMQITFKNKIRLYLPTSALREKNVIIIYIFILCQFMLFKHCMP